MQESLVTVRDALLLPELARGVPEVVAGDAHLNRKIRWAHAAEVPHVASLLKGGELLLTTGMGIGRDDAAQRNFIDALCERHVAALVIELGSTLTRIPQALRRAAERADLPLIALHREVRFVEITEAIHREIVDRQGVIIRRAEEFHHGFAELILAGGDVGDVLRLLSTTIANPVVLEKAGVGVVYHATYQSDDDTVLAQFDAVGRGLEGPRGVARPVAVTRDGDPWGSLVALEMDSPITDLDQLALDRAAGLIALVLVRSHEEERLAARHRGDFLASLLDAIEIDETEARARAAAMSFPSAPAALLPVVIGSRALTALPDATSTRIARELTAEFRDRQIPVLAGPHLGNVLAVVSLRSAQDRPRIAGVVAECTRVAAEKLGVPSTHTVVLIGGSATSWTAARDRLRETIFAMPGARQLVVAPWYDATLPNLEGLFWSLRDNAQLQAFVAARLEPLIRHDARRQLKLLETLRCYYANGCHKANTARALHLERQTLYHRLARIEELLGENLDDEDTLLGLQFSLRARRHFTRGEED